MNMHLIDLIVRIKISLKLLGVIFVLKEALSDIFISYLSAIY